MQAGNSDSNPYLQQEVLSASPLRLRQMLINRAEELCEIVGHLWQNEQFEEASGWLLRIREILGELLSGVRDEKNEVAESVSDFYVFLLQLVNEIEAERSIRQLHQLRDLLAIENETWKQVNYKFGAGADPSDVTADQVEPNSQSIPTPKSGQKRPVDPMYLQQTMGDQSSFNLEL